MRKNIKSIKPKCPEFINDGYKEKVQEAYDKLIKVEESLDKAREKVRSIEQDYQRTKAEWDVVSSMFLIEYETDMPKSWVDIQSVNLLIKNDSDYRNKK